MQFVWSPYELHIEGLNEVNMVYTCNTNEVDMRLINSSHEIHMKFIWISNDLNFMWNPCELHKIYMKSTQEVPLYYTWIWFLASLLCTSYEWASRSIVNMPTLMPTSRPFCPAPFPNTPLVRPTHHWEILLATAVFDEHIPNLIHANNNYRMWSSGAV